MKYSQIAASLLLAGSAMAAPSPTIASSVVARDNTAASMILAIAPKSSACATTTGDCRTNVQAAQPMIDAFDKYDIRTPGEIAGIISLMAYESGDFVYKHNVSPGRPGQGTANMQMFDFNQKYAASIDDLETQVAALGSITDDTGKNNLLALLTDDKYNFGSGPWFYSTQCTDAQKTALQKGDDAGFAQYMACVGVTVADDRSAYWNRAKTAFGL
ncbi:hypothetical protein LQW54_009481 [Pestalotiopsis sp. IQ-011]